MREKGTPGSGEFGGEVPDIWAAGMAGCGDMPETVSGAPDEITAPGGGPLHDEVPYEFPRSGDQESGDEFLDDDEPLDGPELSPYVLIDEPGETFVDPLGPGSTEAWMAGWLARHKGTPGFVVDMGDHVGIRDRLADRYMDEGLPADVPRPDPTEHVQPEENDR